MGTDHILGEGNEKNNLTFICKWKHGEKSYILIKIFSFIEILFNISITYLIHFLK